ncbi:alpha-N-arabinofuranosidase [Synoicihabitans lomoniglobus]|uniref:non-reducing end alpha-L-arabinofuranosidase n=1 Tax=Synoicihabitans lomoniglobus TaxID=2909285 RepID=A0AAE9ZUA6_9BACT|nr:alpha-N-arabinofuranosidase [Opitutaceae bacterium LMO-M01]WED64227.1 alpha-N-arabinofuranosidase [Opitutaceae bacterium LMO-M01]
MKFPRLFLLLGSLALSTFTGRAAEATLTLHGDQTGPVISPEIYGHFAEHLGRCIYEGIWVGPDSDIPNTRGMRNDVLHALQALDIPVLRWPGGCFADEYHWRDGIGPREKRPAMINTHWGGVVESNHFGTHEFMDLVELLDTEAYISGNVGSGTVQEMMEWVEYLTSDADSPIANQRRANGRDRAWKVRYFGVGNESWGCGGSMTPEYYSDLFRRYNTFVKNYDRANPIYRIACGASGTDYHWTETLMGKVGHRMDGLSLHWYTLPTGNWSDKGSATVFAEDQWFSTLRQTLRMDEIVTQHSAIMDAHDPDKKIGLIVDEWGTWYDVEPGTGPGFLYQQNTLRDAIVAGLNFHIFHAHADRIHMANIAQMINVLQAMILTDGPRMLRTPTYHVFEMFKVHQGATVVPLELDPPDYTHGDASIPAVSASASRRDDGTLHLSLVNTDPHHAQTVSCTLDGVTATTVRGRILTAPSMHTHNTFDAPDTVVPVAFTGASLDGNTLTVALPAMSVVMLSL